LFKKPLDSEEIAPPATSNIDGDELEDDEEADDEEDVVDACGAGESGGAAKEGVSSLRWSKLPSRVVSSLRIFLLGCCEARSASWSSTAPEPAPTIDATVAPLRVSLFSTSPSIPPALALMFESAVLQVETFEMKRFHSQKACGE